MPGAGSMYQSPYAAVLGACEDTMSAFSRTFMVSVVNWGMNITSETIQMMDSYRTQQDEIILGVLGYRNTAPTAPCG